MDDDMWGVLLIAAVLILAVVFGPWLTVWAWNNSAAILISGCAPDTSWWQGIALMLLLISIGGWR